MSSAKERLQNAISVGGTETVSIALSPSAFLSTESFCKVFLIWFISQKLLDECFWTLSSLNTHKRQGKTLLHRVLLPRHYCLMDFCNIVHYYKVGFKTRSAFLLTRRPAKQYLSRLSTSLSKYSWGACNFFAFNGVSGFTHAWFSLLLSWNCVRR